MRLQLGNNDWKRSLIPNVEIARHLVIFKVGDRVTGLAVGEQLMRYQLVGGVRAYQG